MFKDKGDTQQAGFTLPQDSGSFVENIPAGENTDSGTDIDPEFQQFEQQPEPAFVQKPVPQLEPKPQPQRQVVDSPPARTPTVALTPVASQFLLNSRNAVQSVSYLLSSVPTNLSVTLLSYTAQFGHHNYFATPLGQHLQQTHHIEIFHSNLQLFFPTDGQ